MELKEGPEDVQTFPRPRKGLSGSARGGKAQKGRGLAQDHPLNEW